MTNYNDLAISHFLEHEFMNMPMDPHGRILDLGYGEGPYKKLYQDKFQSCIAADYNIRSNDLDVRLDATCLPFPNDTFDAVLMSEVIEHVPEFQSAINEVCRVLKPDGVLLITWPFNYMMHEVPNDYCRLTEFGMNRMLSNCGVGIELMVRRGGVIALIVVLADFLFKGALELLCRVPVFGSVFKLIKPMLHAAALYIPHKLLLNRFMKECQTKNKPGDALKGVSGQMAHWTLGYCVRARKRRQSP